MLSDQGSALLRRRTVDTNDEFVDQEGDSIVDSVNVGTKGISFRRGVVTYFRGFVGPMVLILPSLFYHTGYAVSLVLMILIAFIETYTIVLLIRTSAHTGIDTFSGIAEKAIGSWGKPLVDASLFISQISFAVTGIIFGRQTIQGILASYDVHLDLWIIMSIITVACILATWIRRIKSMGIALLIANILLMCSLILVLVSYGIVIDKDGIQPMQPVHPDQIVPFFTSAISTFEGIGVVLPIRRAMENKNDFTLLIVVSMTLISAFYLLFSLLGYAAYGSELRDFVTLNVPDSGGLGTVCKAMYGIGVLITFPLVMFPAIEVVERLVVDQHLNSSGGHEALGKGEQATSNRSYWRRNLIRSVLGGVCGIVAYFAGGSFFRTFISLVGAICALPLALIYPIVFHTILMRPSITFRYHILHLSICIIGISSSILSVLYALNLM